LDNDNIIPPFSHFSKKKRPVATATPQKTNKNAGSPPPGLKENQVGGVFLYQADAFSIQ
jgi:hypothetical protein